MRSALLIAVGAILWPLWAETVASQREGMQAQLQFLSQRRVDSVPVREEAGMEPCPAAIYSIAVSTTGQLGTLRLPPACQKRHDPEAVGNIALRNATGSWSAITLPGWHGQTHGAKAPQLAFDPAGSLFIAWVAVDETGKGTAARLLVMKQAIEGTLSAPILLSDVETPEIDSVSILSRGRDQLDALWADARDRAFGGWSHPTVDTYLHLFSRSLTRTTLSETSRVTPKRGKHEVSGARATLGPDGRIYVIWDQVGSGEGQQVYLAVGDSMTWSKPVRVSDEKTRWPHAHLYFDVANLPNGRALALWQESSSKYGLRWRIYDHGRLGDTRRFGDRICCFDAETSSDGTVHLIFQDETPFVPTVASGPPPATRHRHKLFYSAFQAGEWTAITEIATDVFKDSADLAVDEQQRLHLLWQQYDSGYATLIHAVAEARMP